MNNAKDGDESEEDAADGMGGERDDVRPFTSYLPRNVAALSEQFVFVRSYMKLTSDLLISKLRMTSWMTLAPTITTCLPQWMHSYMEVGMGGGVVEKLGKFDFCC